MDFGLQTTRPETLSVTEFFVEDEIWANDIIKQVLGVTQTDADSMSANDFADYLMRYIKPEGTVIALDDD